MRAMYPTVVRGEPEATGRTWRISVRELDRSRAVFGGVVVLTVAPIVAAALSLVGRHWHPASDLAVQLLQIDDVGGRHTPLAGAQSRYGWDHPGPLLLWLLAPFDWLFGTTGVLVGVALLNTAVIVGALVVARRRGGVTLTALVAVVLLVLIAANDTDLFVNPWNPWVAVLPFFTYLLLAWSLADGDIAVAPWLVGVGSFIIQAHVGYAPLALGAGVIAASMLGWRSRRVGDGGGRLRRSAVMSLGVAAVLWLPPIVQQLTSDNGNLAAIVEFLRHPPEPHAGWRLAWGIMGTELGPPGAWLAGDELGPFGVVPGSTLPAVVLLAVTVAAGVLAYRRGAASAGRLAVLVVASCALGVVATSRVTGLVGTYLVRWWWVLAAAVWLSIGWSAACCLGRQARHGLLGVAVAATGVMSVVVSARAVPAGLPDANQSTAVAALASELTTGLDRDAAYLVDWTDAEFWGAVGIGVFVELDRLGYDVSVSPSRAPQFGKWLTARAEDVDATVLVIGSTDAAHGVEPPPGAAELARFDAAGGEDYAIYLYS
jgi:hypothetical protein